MTTPLKAKLLHHLSNEIFCKIGVSSTHGVGVFALKFIPKDTAPLHTLSKHREVRIETKELKSLPKAVRDYIDSFCFVDEGTTYVPSNGMNAMDMAVYLNHSKTPNLRFLPDGKLVAVKSIRAGEELFIDYDASFGGEHTFK